MEKINIYWKGPFELEDIESNEFLAKEIYQIYGTHPIYGGDTLLYIGKTEKQNFKKRIQDEKKVPYPWCHRTSGTLKVYLGTLENSNKTIIDAAEKLLIVSHMPATNSSGIKKSTLYDNYHLMNWNEFHKLLPEVTSDRWFYFPVD